MQPIQSMWAFPFCVGSLLVSLLAYWTCPQVDQRMLMWASPHSQDPVLFERLPPYPISISLANEEQTDKPRCRLHFRKMRD
jgi:hypothetical protein